MWIGPEISPKPSWKSSAFARAVIRKKTDSPDEFQRPNLAMRENFGYVFFERY
jgi:hypothetical protein